MKSIRELWPALASIVLSYAAGLLSGYLGSLWFDSYAIDGKPLLIAAAPAGVTGADLIANLLTISALVISGCFVYICLPSDRLELRIATHVKTCFIDELVDEVMFKEYFASTPDDRLTSNELLLRAFLAPKIAVGGWHRMSRQILIDVFGEDTTRKLLRYVDEHADARWLVAMSIAIGCGMIWGALCLAVRYLGLNTLFYSGSEAGCIVALLFLNLFTSMLAVWLALGGNNIEKTVRMKVTVCVRDAQQKVSEAQAERRDQTLNELAGINPSTASGSARQGRSRARTAGNREA